MNFFVDAPKKLLRETRPELTNQTPVDELIIPTKQTNSQGFRKEALPCIGLRGGRYTFYARTSLPTRTGGVAANAWVAIAKEIFPYKQWVPESTSGVTDTGDDVADMMEVDDDDLSGDECSESENETETGVEGSIPVTNNYTKRRRFTDAEVLHLHDRLERLGQWEIKPDDASVYSTVCEGFTKNLSQICGPCGDISKHPGLQRALRKSEALNKLPPEEQDVTIRKRLTHRNIMLADKVSILTKANLKNPFVMKIIGELTRGGAPAAFLTLYKQAVEGRMENSSLFTQICAQFAD
jgi:hypothetical protein